MNKADLIAFETEVAEAFKAKRIKGPVHLSGGNEDQLIEIFKNIRREDWVFSTYRNHYHALLHGLPPEWLMAEILAGRSMNISSPGYRFYTSAIVGGCLPIAVGVAAAIKRAGSKRKVWCFVGDMAKHSGAFSEAFWYATGHALPLQLIVEDNGMSVDTPTEECWSPVSPVGQPCVLKEYKYERIYPHSGIGHHVF